MLLARFALASPTRYSDINTILLRPAESRNCNQALSAAIFQPSHTFVSVFPFLYFGFRTSAFSTCPQADLPKTHDRGTDYIAWKVDKKIPGQTIVHPGLLLRDRLSSTTSPLQDLLQVKNMTLTTTITKSNADVRKLPRDILRWLDVLPVNLSNLSCTPK